ncbi:retrovirus-related pol polyprotein from transposon TNT 1-94 [Tanacetum coccineum]
MSETEPIPPTSSVTALRIPIIKKGEYDLWSMKMRQYIAITDHILWDIITNGNQTTTDPASPSVSAPKTSLAANARRNNEKALNILLSAIPDRHLLSFHDAVDARSLWKAIKARFGGNEASKKMQKNLLKQQFETFTIGSREELDSAYERFQHILSMLELHDATVSIEDANLKFLRSLPSVWHVVATMIRGQPGLDELDFDDLYNNLKVYEHELKGVSNSNSQNIAFLSTEIQKRNAPETDGNLFSDSSNNFYDGNQVPGAFVKHYNKFLGAEGVSNPLDAHDLFIRALDNSKADFMVRDVTDDEIKNVMFFIGDDRAPGPDGFTPVFFKKAWDVVSGDITCAIRDFFLQWPISCCNVLYKCISKIIANHVKEGLGDIVSINQSAFVPGRRISDNILLTQELMRNYHGRRGPPRCAFKVDIQKAYDTVDWKFLKTILVGFGFHPKMVQWIMVCVSGASYTNYVMTFTLFARGHPSSVSVIMDALEEFKQVSGLVPSIPKSTAYFCNVPNAIKASILNSMPFAEGVLPVSGCSRSMTGFKCYLHKYVEQPGPKVVFGDNSSCITEGYGSINYGGIVFTKVAFVIGLKYNLISISQLCNAKYIVKFDDKQGTIINANKEIVLIAPRRNDVYVLNMSSLSLNGACFFAKASKSVNWIWHKRLSHLNFKNINKLAKQNKVLGLPSLVYLKDKPCTTCEKGKHHRASFKTKQNFSIRKCLHLHMNLFRPVSPMSINHEKYTLVIVDKYSRTVNGTKFRNHELESFCDEKGISQNFSSPYTPEQNGVAERKSRTLIEAARKMLNGLALSKNFWTKAVRIACYTQNKSIIVKRHDKTPYEIFRERIPDISYFHVFRCVVFIHNHKDHVSKFDAKVDDGYFLRYSFVSKAFRVFNTRRQKIEETYHVTFNESMEAIRFTHTLENEIGIDDSSRYPPDEFVREDDPSRQYQIDYDISYNVIPHGRSLSELTKDNQVPKVIALNEPNIPHTEDTKENNTKVSRSITKSLVPNVTQSHISNQASTSSHPVLQDRCMATKLTATSASESLFANFLSEIEPKTLSKALKHPGWVDAMQEELN